MSQEDSSDNTEDKDIAALFEKALLHYRDGNLQQAQDECLRILRKQRRPDVILILAKIAHEQREFEIAVERYQQFLEIMPSHEQTHLHLAAVLEELGHTERAIAHYQQVLVIKPDDVSTMMNLGGAFTQAKRIPESILIYEQALAFSPDSALAHRRLGASLQIMGQVKKAIKCFEQALSLRPEYFEVRIELALALRQLGRAEEALVSLEEALKLKPDDDDAHINLALTHKQLGQVKLAVERLEQLIAIRPSCGRAYYHLSIIKPEKAQIPAIEKLLNDPELPESDAIYCHFSVANIYDSRECFDRAFASYLTANKLHRATLTYDAKENIQYVDRLIKVYSTGFFQGKRQFGSSSTLPVFIVGMPRSGTTLVEQILSSHQLVHGAGEIRACPGINYSIAQQLKVDKPDPECMSLIDGKMVEDYSARYLQELTLHSTTAARITDKEPGNFFRIGLIKTLFPDARIINCQRNPLDNCVSVFFHFFTAFQSSFDLTELGQFYLDYQRLMVHWQSVFPSEIFTVQYEDLVADQETLSKQLIEYVGLEWDENCLEFYNNDRNVMTPSNIQVRQPIYESSINRWKRYEKHLQPLIETLQKAG